VISYNPDLIPRNALHGITVGISVSDSADLARLGLDKRHAELAVGEITRAILIAGGTIAYGGRLRPSGFTQQLMNEVGRFGVARHSLTLYLAFPEHRTMTRDELDHLDRQLGTWGKLITLDAQGEPTEWRHLEESPEALPDNERTTAYSGLRRYMAANTHGRILVGGKLRDFLGTVPGVVEEAILAVEHGQPLYLAGGFGGAAAAVARRLDPGSFDWLPPGLPEGENGEIVQAALGRLQSVAFERQWDISINGLTPEHRALLSASHRPGEVASLCVVGLAAKFASHPEGHG
jgi:hypothetical protein